MLSGDSSRMVGLVQLLLKSNAANCLVEDYAACLELRSEESPEIENSNEDPGVLILQVCSSSYYCIIEYLNLVAVVMFIYFPLIYLQLLIDNISRPAPNATHLLLKFDLDNNIERTVLQPKFHYRLVYKLQDFFYVHNSLLNEPRL